jgi:hypothetical protein
MHGEYNVKYRRVNLWRGTGHVAYLHCLRTAQKWISELITYYVLIFSGFTVYIEAFVAKLQSYIVRRIYAIK